MSELVEGAAAPVLPRRGERRKAVEARGTISSQLRDLLRSRGETMGAIARSADLSPKVLERFVSGRRGLTLASLDRLGLALGLRIGEGIGRAKPSKPKRKETRAK